MERKGDDERGKAGALGYRRRGGDEKDGDMLFVVRVVRKSIGEKRRLAESRLRGAGGRCEGASDSDDEESSEEVSSSESGGCTGMVLDGAGGAGGEGTELNESDK
jgi:hypothetical protein